MHSNKLQTIDVNVGVALPESDTVWPCKVPKADKMTLLEVAEKIQKDVRRNYAVSSQNEPNRPLPHF